MTFSPNVPRSGAVVAFVLLSLAACTPALDWREVQGGSVPFSVMMPAKPKMMTRQLALDGMPVTMTMTAAEVDGVTFAVGSVELADAEQARRAMQAMRVALVNNIHGKILHETAADASSVQPGALHSHRSIELEALGTTPDGRSRLLAARFVAQDRRAYQALVTGAQKAVSREQIDTFLTSFKVD